jgi:hypothetical protein
MGFMSIIWTVRYYIYQKGAIVSVIKIPTASNRVSSDSPRSPAVMKSSLSIFRKKTYSRLQRTFTFGVDKHTLIP